MVGATLGLAACSGQESPAAGGQPAPASPSIPAEERTEVDGPQPRLVVGTETGATVFSIGDGGALTSEGDVATNYRPSVSVGSDDRHVYLNQGDFGLTQILDAGSWGQAHGDHSHYYTKEPSLRELVLKGKKPSHVVSHDDRTAVFYDGTGAATVFRDAGLTIGKLDKTEVDAGTGAHHGVAIALEESIMISIAQDGEAAGVSVRSADGSKELARHENCPGLHGEATVHGEDDDTVIFGCADGVLAVTGTEAEHIKNPTQDDEQRVSSFTVGGDEEGPRSHLVVGNYGAESLGVIDLETKKLSEVKIGTDYSGRARTADGDVAVLTTDGRLRVINPETGKETATIEVLDKFTIPEDWKISTPKVAVVGDQAFVTDPAKQVVIPVDLETEKVGEHVALTAEPNNLVPVNAAGADDHDHDHE